MALSKVSGESRYSSNMRKVEQLDKKLDGFLNGLKKTSGIDTKAQKIKIFCAKDERDETKRLLRAEMANVDADLHRFIEVVASETAEFIIERQKGGPGSQIYYMSNGVKHGVTLGCIVVNLVDKKLYALTTCHRDGVRGTLFYFMHNGEEFELGKCVAVTDSCQPLNESCLIELSQAGLNLCCPCLGNIKPPVVFSGPYIGPSYDLAPTEVLMVTETLKRGTIRYTNLRFPDPEDSSTMYTGGIVTMPVDDDNLARAGYSGAFIVKASAQHFLVNDWCQSGRTTQNTVSADSISDGYQPPVVEGLIRNAVPVDPSQNLAQAEGVALNPDTPQMNPPTQLQVQSPPMPMNPISRITEVTQSVAQALRGSFQWVVSSMRSLVGGNVVGDSTTGHSCKCSLAHGVMAHEAISMHCFGITHGEYKRGSLSFRLDLTLREFEEQLVNAKFALVPVLKDCQCTSRGLVR